MAQLQLLRLPPDNGGLGAFEQYIPGNMRTAALGAQNLCVGVIYDGMACGAALIVLEEAPYLRWITVDPQARYCGVGTYLLKGVLGLAETLFGGESIRCVLPPEAGGTVSGIFARTGFSRPEPFATAFSCPLGELVPPGYAGTVAVLPVLALPEALLDQYFLAIMEADLPDFADFRKLREPIPGLCLAAVAEETFAGVILCEKQQGIAVRGLYTMPALRGRGVARALVNGAIAAAQTVYPPETPVTTTTITSATYGLCRGIFAAGGPERKAVLAMEYKYQ